MVKDVDVWHVEEMQGSLEKIIAYLDLLVDTYSSVDAYKNFTVKDGDALALHLVTGRELVEALRDRTAVIINEAYGRA